MAEEPTLPRFPSWNSETHTINTRKRVRGGQDPASSLFSNSSDPAVFSSDDDPNLENYTQGRRKKKKYFGSWYQQRLASGDSTFSDDARPKPKTKRTFQRHFDSGVWMGSDASTDMEDSFLIDGPTASGRMPQLHVSRPPPRLSEPEEIARAKITEAIASNQEAIDLMSLGLETLSNAIIEPLSEFSCIPTIDSPDVAFERVDPSLKIYLGVNPLTRVPGALFNLEFLTALSLRGSQITELPPAIGNLRNLEELNIASNRLQYLPGELLDLMAYPSKLKNLNIDPNPFYRPATDIDNLPLWDSTSLDENSENIAWLLKSTISSSRGPIRVWIDKRDGSRNDGSALTPYFQLRQSDARCHWHGRILARSPVQYMDSHGVVISRFQLAEETLNNTTNQQVLIDIGDLASRPSIPQSLNRSNTTSRVLSLTELALQSCSRAPQFPPLASYFPPDTSAHLVDPLERITMQADANAGLGDLPCSTCRRRIIVPIAQWIEWWEYYRYEANDVAPWTPDELDPMNIEFDEMNTKTPSLRNFLDGYNEVTRVVPVPFMKRACSLACLPKPMDMPFRTGLPGTLRWSIKIKEQED